MRNFILAGFLCLGLSSARAWDPNKPFIYEMRIAFETDNWINMYSTATVLSKSDNTVAFRVVANSTTSPTYQLIVTTQGNVGVGTESPAQKLSVVGTIESTTGGFKFPDGSTQTAAGIASPASPQEGDLLYYSNGAWSRLPAGGWGQTLRLGDTYTKLLLHADGADAGTTFTDSVGGKTVTANGNAQIDTAQSQFGGASGLFDGSGDYLSLSDSDDWYFGTGNFTIDFWVKFAVVVGISFQAFYSQTDGSDAGRSLDLYLYQGNYLYMQSAPGQGNFYCSFSPSVNTWYHLAFIKSGSAAYIFVNGVSQSLTQLDAWGTLPNSSGDLRIGEYRSGTGYVNGWIDELRVSKGVARWTSNFTPPAAAYSPSLSWSN